MSKHGTTIRAALIARKNGKSFREIAKKYSTSISTIYEWVKLYGLEARKIRTKKALASGRPPLLSKLTKEVIILLAKMTRYNTSRLYELLLPFLGSLQRLGGSKWNGTISLRTIKRVLNDAEVGTGYQSKIIDEPGTFVAHGVSIHWKQVGNSQLQKYYLLCLCERNSGIIYCHAYKQIKDDSLYKRINELEKIYQARVKKIIFATERQKSGTDPKRIATIIRRLYNAERKILKKDRTKKYKNLRIISGTATIRRMTAIPMPRRYSSIERLNKVLHIFADRYNGTERPLMSDKKMPEEDKELMPYNRLWRVVEKFPDKSYYTKQTFLKKVKFPKPQKS